MILDMIQGCRYLRRSTDRWLLSKNSMTRLKDSKVGTGSVLLWNCSIPITNTKGLYLYPCLNTTPGRLRVQHSLPKLMSRHQCPFRTRHQFVPSSCPGHVITYSRKLPFQAQTALLPNDGVLPTASIFTESFEENFLPNGASLPNSAHKSVPFLYQFLVLTISLGVTHSEISLGQLAPTK
jgi:hypothetical protein